MKGCIPFSTNQIKTLLSVLKSNRDKALLVIGITTGLRISELLSLKIEDVFSKGKIHDYIYIKKANTKGKTNGINKKIDPIAKKYLQVYLKSRASLAAERPLWLSQKGQTLDRRSVWRIINTASKSAGLSGKIGTHSMRKTHAKQAFVKSKGSVLHVKEALNHKSIDSTLSYLQSIELENLNMEWEF